MKIELQNQLLCSAVNIHNRTVHYGNADIIPFMVLSMIYDLTGGCIDIEHECQVKLNNLAQSMITKSKDICNTRGESAFFQNNDANIGIRVFQKPSLTVGNNSVYFGDGLVTKNFTEGNFTKSFSGNEANTIMIVTLPSYGVLYYNGEKVVPKQIINISDLNKLVYERIDDERYQDSFIFQTSDNETKTFSNMATFEINVEGKINEPPTVGDGSATTNYNTPLVFTRAMFTTATTPPYSDPEGDAALKLKITSLPSTGTIKLNGVDISVNDEFDFTTDIDSGNLTYVPNGAITGEQNLDFTFSIADAGSGIFSS